jgi:hypothetical protein
MRSPPDRNSQRTPLLVDHVAGVDVAGQLQVDRLAPRPLDPVGPDHVAGVVVGELGRQVDVVAALVLAELGGPDRTDIGLQRGADRRPVHQVLGPPDQQARIGVERRVGHVVVVAVLEDRRIGMVAGQDGVEERPVAQVGLALALDPLGPGRSRAGGRRAGQRPHLGGPAAWETAGTAAAAAPVSSEPRAPRRLISTMKTSSRLACRSLVSDHLATRKPSCPPVSFAVFGDVERPPKATSGTGKTAQENAREAEPPGRSEERLVARRA